MDGEQYIRSETGREAGATSGTTARARERLLRISGGGDPKRGRRMNRNIYFGCALLAPLLAFGYPMLNEGTTSVCGAFERKVTTLIAMAGGDGSFGDPFALALMSGLQSVSNGAYAAVLVKQRHPDLPSFIGCSAAYWRLMLDAAEIQEQMPRGRPARMW